MRKVFGYKIGNLCIVKRSVWEDSMIDMLKDRLEKAKIGKKPAERKLIDGIAQVRRNAIDMTALDSELQRTFKEAVNWLAAKGVNIQSVLKTEKSVKV